MVLTGFLLGAVPTVTEANSPLSEKQQQLELLLQIKRLLDVVQSLQNELAARQKTGSSFGEVVTVSQNRIPYESRFYFFPYEEIYFIENNKLVNADGSKTVRKIDQQLFDLFVGVVGERAVAGHVREWRIFYDRKRDLAAYVELVSRRTNDPIDWIMGINREGFNSDPVVVRSFANLFIHEYGHILFYEKPEFEKNYRTDFWTSSDEEHKENLKQVKADRQFQVARNYFEENRNRFVSEYATNSVNEDMAETFIYFVREDKPQTTTVRDRKILAFYQEPELVEIRTQIRNNLRILGVGY